MSRGHRMRPHPDQFRAARSLQGEAARSPTRALGQCGACAPGEPLCAAAFGLWRARRPAQESGLSLLGAGRRRAAPHVACRGLKTPQL
jgi:hypothetical protein